MQIRPLEDLTKYELIALIQRERQQYEAVGAGGVSLLWDAEPGYMQIAFAQMKAIAAKDAEIARLREALESVWLWMEGQVDGQSKGGHATFDILMLREQRDIARAALTQQEQV